MRTCAHTHTHAVSTFSLCAFLKHAGLRDERELTIGARLGCGAIAGSMGQTVAYPFDVARRRLQVRLRAGCTVRGAVRFGGTGTRLGTNDVTARNAPWCWERMRCGACQRPGRARARECKKPTRDGVAPSKSPAVMFGDPSVSPPASASALPPRRCRAGRAQRTCTATAATWWRTRAWWTASCGRCGRRACRRFSRWVASRLTAQLVP